MHEESDLIRQEIADVAKIVSDECWLEGQRRGCFVCPSDTVIQQRVAEIILTREGARMRQAHQPATA